MCVYTCICMFMWIYIYIYIDIYISVYFKSDLKLINVIWHLQFSKYQPKNILQYFCDSLHNLRYLVTHLMGADLNNIVKCQKLTDDHVQFLIYQILRGLKVSLPPLSVPSWVRCRPHQPVYKPKRA